MVQHEDQPHHQQSKSGMKLLNTLMYPNLLVCIVINKQTSIIMQAISNLKEIGKMKLRGGIRNRINHETVAMLYKTLIMPNFDYCYYIYYCMNRKDVHLLQRLQNMALEHVLHVDKIIPKIEVQARHLIR